jgi:dCTP deaminase
MAFWSGETLFDLKERLVEPFDEGQIDCNSYVLRMGGQYYRTGDYGAGSEGFQKRTPLSEKESFIIPPGQFAFLLTKETVKVPKNAMAFISMRTSIKFQGLINVSGFHVDPGYDGKLVYGVHNASPSPIQLCEDDQVFKIWFCSMDRESGLKYVKPANEGFDAISSEMVRGMDREILSLQSLAEKLRDQQEEIDRKFAEQKPTIDNLTFIWRAMIISLTVTVTLTIGSFLLPAAYDQGKRLWDRFQQLPTEQQPPTEKKN